MVKSTLSFKRNFKIFCKTSQKDMSVHLDVAEYMHDFIQNAPMLPRPSAA
jgi:hypothetical protein